MAAKRSLLIRIAAVSVGLGVAVLPWWDAVAAMRSGGSGTAPLLVGALLCVNLSFVFLRGTWGRRWLTLAAAAVVFLLHSAISMGSTMLERSRIADTWPTCETGHAPAGVQAVVPPDTHIDGPRLRTGEPCAPASEERELHRRQWPGGDLGDGFRQVIGRFPGDLKRMLLPPMIATFLLALAGVLLAKDGAPFDAPVNGRR